MKLGKLQEVDIRTVWQHEQYDFSKWLAAEENIQELGDVLGLHDCQPARDQLVWGGALNYLVGACSYCDRITTVSPTMHQAGREIGGRSL